MSSPCMTYSAALEEAFTALTKLHFSLKTMLTRKMERGSAGVAIHEQAEALLQSRLEEVQRALRTVANVPAVNELRSRMWSSLAVRALSDIKTLDAVVEESISVIIELYFAAKLEDLAAATAVAAPPRPRLL